MSPHLPHHQFLFKASTLNCLVFFLVKACLWIFIYIRMDALMYFYKCGLWYFDKNSVILYMLLIDSFQLSAFLSELPYQHLYQTSYMLFFIRQCQKFSHFLLLGDWVTWNSILNQMLKRLFIVNNDKVQGKGIEFDGKNSLGRPWWFKKKKKRKRTVLRD